MDAGTVWADRYRVSRRLGSGGMGTVWAAEDLRLRRMVAIKRMHVPSGPDRSRFEREARLGASLRHPSLVTIYDILTIEAAVLLVMEHVDGPSLAQRLRQGRMPPAEVVSVLRDVAAALDHAHGRGIIHRDVKPANILIGSDGRGRLADLGIAVALESTALTAEGDLLGTPAYLSPEQIEGEPASPAADVYALATVAWEALAGRKAHTGESPLQVLGRIRRRPAPDVREAWPEAPPAAAAALAEGMARRPQERPASATELVRRLEAGLKVTPEPPTVVMAVADAPPGPGGAGEPPPSGRLEVISPEDRRAAAAVTPPPVPAPTPVPMPTPVRAPSPVRPSSPVRAPTPPPARTAPPPPLPSRHRDRRPLAALGALLAIAAAVVLVVLTGKEGGTETARTPAATATPERGRDAAAPEATATPRATATATATSTATPTATATPRRAARSRRRPGSTPASAVRGFYELAAAGDFDAAWELTGAGFRAQFGSQARLAGTFTTLQSIEFLELDADRRGSEATVTATTVARHTDRTDRCSGSFRTALGEDGVWRIASAGVSCTS